MIEALKSMCVALVIGLITIACQPDSPNHSTEAPMKQESAPESQIEAETKLINPEDWRPVWTGPLHPRLPW